MNNFSTCFLSNGHHPLGKNQCKYHSNLLLAGWFFSQEKLITAVIAFSKMSYFVVCKWCVCLIWTFRRWNLAEQRKKIIENGRIWL